MRYEVEIEGRPQPVVVTRTGDRVTVTIAGRDRAVDVQPVPGHPYLLSLLIEGASFEVTVVPERASPRRAVSVGPTPVPVTLLERGRAGRRVDGAAAGSGPQRVVAPMPGKIVRVLVAPGEAVRRHQPLVVVEAMKMENELRAVREGTVSEVAAKEGVSVDAGTLLVVIQ